jgi:hypothetical protein
MKNRMKFLLPNARVCRLDGANAQCAFGAPGQSLAQPDVRDGINLVFHRTIETRLFAYTIYLN